MPATSPTKVLVGSLDCFARSLADLQASLSWLQGKGIRFIALHEDVDVDPKTGAGESFFEDLTLLAKAQSNMNVRNVHAGIARARSLGVHCGRPQRRFSRTQACQLRRRGSASAPSRPDWAFRARRWPMRSQRKSGRRPEEREPGGNECLSDRPVLVQDRRGLAAPLRLRESHWFVMMTARRRIGGGS